jgi:hypothetical protein
VLGRKLAAGAAPLAASLVAFPAAGAALRAERITEATAAELLIGGPDAIGGVGDWYLANDVVEVIVDDPARRHAKLNYGGTIVDAGLRDRRGEDQFARLFPVVNMDQKVSVDYDAIAAQVDPAGGWARLVVTSSGMSSLPRSEWPWRWLDPMVPEPDEVREVRVETEYSVFPGEPFVRIATTLRNEGSAPAPVFAYGDVWMRGGRGPRSFVGNALAPERSVGYQHKSFDRHNVAGAGDAMVAFTHVVVPGVRHFPPIGYALVAPERAARGLPSFGVTDEHVTFVNAFTFDPDWDVLSLWRIARATQHTLAPGEAWTYRRRLLVVGRPDAASATDVIFRWLGVADGRSGLEGRCLPPGVPCAVHVHAAGTGAPVTQILAERAGPDAGRYRAVLPPGDYRLVLRAPQRPEREIRVSVPDGRFASVPPQWLEEPGWLVFDPAFADGGPGRIAVRAAGDGPDPVFHPELLDFRIDGRPGASGSATRDLHFASADGDPERVAVPPGRYRLVATRGYEHDAAAIEVEVTGPGHEVRVPPFALTRVVDPGPFLIADLHVHAQASDDSAMPNAARLRSMLAEGVDVMVSSDHDHLGDFRPALEALGVGDRIRVIQGVEVTSSTPSAAAPWTIGHSNAWPLRYRPWAHRRGAPPSQNLRLADLYALLRSDYGAEVVQLNHPRGDEPDAVRESAYLTHLGSAGRPYDPARPIAEGPNALLLEPAPDGRTRAVDFDAMELMNGVSFRQYRLVRRDWYSLLDQGFRRTGTANSDTHGPDQLAAYPRNYVQVDGGRWEPSAFDAAIREGRVVGTNGPLIPRFRVNGGRMGDRVGARDGRVRIQFEVAAAPWVPVDEVRLLVNGEVARRYPLDPRATAPTRIAERTELALTGDAYINLEAGAPIDADPDAWIAAHPGLYTRVLAPGFVPAAFTNPVFVDVDGNGRFDPPGLPAPPPGLAGPVGLVAAAGLVGTALWWRRRRSREGGAGSGGPAQARADAGSGVRRVRTT